jgi:adenosylcobinamide-phosphate synthase
MSNFSGIDFGELAQSRLTVLAAALVLDFCFGEWPNALHPVVWIGNTIAFSMRLAPPRGTVRQFVFGLLIATLIPAIFTAGAVGILFALRTQPAAQWIVSVLLLKSMFALRALRSAAWTVRDALRQDGVADARFGLRSLCSRDASNLSAPQLIAATIESVAENASDSFVAPLLYFALFGLPGAVCYRAVNTLDSMIGYHGKYEYLGKASARCDDLLNLIPSRITALLILIGGTLARQDVVRGLRTLWRDGAVTESPNAGRPMAAMAGLLRVELEKVGHYRLGEPIEALTVEKIEHAWRIVILAALTGVLLFALAQGALHVYSR